MCVYIYTFIIILEFTLLTYRKIKFSIKQYALLYQQQPHTSCVCYIPGFHHFSLGLYLISCCFDHHGT